MNYKANVASIKESLDYIMKQLEQAPSKGRPNNEIKTSATKIYSIVIENGKVEKFYFIHSICQACIHAKPNKVDKLMKVLLPSPPNNQSMSLVSDFISYALCQPTLYSDMLDHLSVYLNSSDLVHVDVESWHQAETLALDSPTFCAALISRHDLPQLGISKRLLAKWLQDLTKIDHDFPPPSLNQLIRFSLFPGEIEEFTEAERHRLELIHSDYHLGILTLIQSKRCQMLTNQFLIDLIGELAKETDLKSNDVERSHLPMNTKVIDKFAQILSVAVANKVITLTSPLKNSLSSLESNQLIASVIKWRNK